jgi:hypothetical protein
VSESRILGGILFKLKKVFPITLAAIGAFTALSMWAFASPPGSGPDDDFHLPSIWCSHGQVDGICDPEFAGDGYGKTPTPLSPSAICFAFKSDQSAACQANMFDWQDKKLSGSRTNEEGRFPNGFYWTLNFLIGDNTLNSAMLMRIFNSLLAVSLLFMTAIFATPRSRVSLIASWAVVSVPLAMFTIASTNPSSWSIIGIGTYWVSLLSYLRSKTLKYSIINGILLFISGLIAIQSRSEASPYLILSTLIVFIIHFNWKELFSLNKRFILPTIVVLLAFYEFLTTPSTLGWSTGLPGGDPNRSSRELWFRNISDWPTFITGSLGGWPLGWLDVPMPSMVYFCAMFAFIGVLFTGLLNLNWRKSIAILLIVSTLVILPLRILALGKNYVGENVQPRYFLPLLFLLVGIAVFSPKNVEAFYLSYAQVIVAAFFVTSAHAFALHFTMRRYLTGSDVVDWNLNKSVEWWWSFMPSPMASWALASLGFAVALSVGLWQLRKPVKEDY